LAQACAEIITTLGFSTFEIFFPLSGLKVYFWLWEHLCNQVKIFRRTAKILGAELRLLGAQLQILEAPTPKE